MGRIFFVAVEAGSKEVECLGAKAVFPAVKPGTAHSKMPVSSSLYTMRRVSYLYPGLVSITNK
jgi:hypothetical protein